MPAMRVELDADVAALLERCPMTPAGRARRREIEAAICLALKRSLGFDELQAQELIAEGLRRRRAGEYA